MQTNDLISSARQTNPLPERAALSHGGRLRAAATAFAIPLSDWLDLSTGINPNGWPAPPLPPSCWQRLPEEEDGLEAAARDHYGCASLLPVAGSQAAIQALPRLRWHSRVAVLAPAYAEHAAAWAAAGHEVGRIDALSDQDGASARSGGPGQWHDNAQISDQISAQVSDQISDQISARITTQIEQVEVLVLVHPNNPTGLRFATAQLLAWHSRLAQRGGWLIVDEAFMDATPQRSLAGHCPRPGLVVLRSLGKFFGLAGARVGFVLAEADLLARLQRQLGPWTLTGPARWVATQALRDHAWQARTRRDLTAAGQRLGELLSQHGLPPSGGCALFAWVRTERAEQIWRQLARQGILTRLFQQPPSLRFGLPGDEPAWQRLGRALRGLG
jgi:cobalamin biosynthetic protein CobC